LKEVQEKTGAIFVPPYGKCEKRYAFMERR